MSNEVRLLMSCINTTSLTVPSWNDNSMPGPAHSHHCDYRQQTSTGVSYHNFWWYIPPQIWSLCLTAGCALSVNNIWHACFSKEWSWLFCLHTKKVSCTILVDSNFLWMATSLNIFFFLYCGTFPWVWMWCMCPSCFPCRLWHPQSCILYLEAPYLWISLPLSQYLGVSFISRTTLLSRNYGTNMKTEQEIKKTIMKKGGVYSLKSCK